jgi:hypothetical protein
MRDYLDICLLLGGLALVVLCVASLWIPKILKWNEKLVVLTPLMRELWWTYSIYVYGSHIFFAILALGFSDFLLGKTAAAAAMSSFIFLWWTVRLFLQFFGFDLNEVEGTALNRLAKHLLTALFVYLVLLYGGLIFWNLGLIN